jgi:hypothetical protein
MIRKYFIDRKTATVILSFAIICSFCLPLFDWHSFEMNGLNYILSTHIPSYKYLLLLIPLSTLFLFLSAAYDDIYFVNRRIFSRIPFLSMIFIFMIRYINHGSENAFSTIDFGFWLMLFFSALLVLTNRKGKEYAVLPEWNHSQGPKDN